MSTASLQHRTGQPHGGARRREAGGAARAASAALPRYLTSGKVTVTRRPRTAAAETAAGEAASRWTAQQGDQPIASGRVTGGSSASPRLLALEGVDPSRIGAAGALGFGETQQFSQHGTAAGATQPITAGRLQANRRVEIRFVHTVSNHPIVMP